MTLKQALLEKAPARHRNPVLGLILVTSAALLFGVVAACIKAIELPTLVLQLCRSVIEWALGVAAAYAYYSGRLRKLPEPRIVPEMQIVPTPTQKRLDASPSSTRDAAEPEDGLPGPPASMVLLLVGPAHLRHWLVLRAFLYWLFLAGWWFALSVMPIGDATTIVYVGPIFTATFAWLLLGETIDWSFYPIVALDGAGLLLITQPSFLFGSPSGSGSVSGDAYALGALSAFCSAVVAGLLPVCTRKSKECFWTAVNHCSSALSALVFTPIAIAIWFAIDADAPAATATSLSELIGLSEGSSPTGASSFLMKRLLLFGATGIGFGGLAMQTLGYQLEEAARASVMTVLEIPFAYGLQFLLFNEPISPIGLVGVGLVICGTLLNVLRRLQLAAQAKAANGA